MSRGLGKSLVQPSAPSRVSQGFRPDYSGICPRGSWNPPVKEMMYVGNPQHCWTVWRKLFLIHRTNLSIFTFSLFSVISVSLSCEECGCGNIGIAELLLIPQSCLLTTINRPSSLSLFSQAKCSSPGHEWPPLTLLFFVNVFPVLGRTGKSIPSVTHTYSPMSTY